MLRAADLFLEHGVEIEAAPSKHAIAQGFFLYGFEPGGNRIEVTTGGYFVYDPDQRADRLERGRAGARPGVGRQDGGELPHVRHAAGAVTDTVPRISYVVARLERALRREIDARLSEHGLTTTQYTALQKLAEYRRLSAQH